MIKNINNIDLSSKRQPKATNFAIFLVLKRFKDYMNPTDKKEVSPHALIYRKHAKPIGRFLIVMCGTFYSLKYLNMYINNSKNSGK